MRLRPHPGTSVLTCKGGCNDGIDHGRCRCCRRGGCARPRSAYPPFQLRPAASATEMNHLTIRNTGKAVTVGTRIVPADTFLSRLFGLLGKTHLEPGWGAFDSPLFGGSHHGNAVSHRRCSAGQGNARGEGLAPPASFSSNQRQLQDLQRSGTARRSS